VASSSSVCGKPCAPAPATRRTAAEAQQGPILHRRGCAVRSTRRIVGRVVGPARPGARHRRGVLHGAAGWSLPKLSASKIEPAASHLGPARRPPNPCRRTLRRSIGDLVLSGCRARWAPGPRPSQPGVTSTPASSSSTPWCHARRCSSERRVSNAALHREPASLNPLARLPALACGGRRARPDLPAGGQHRRPRPQVCGREVPVRRSGPRRRTARHPGRTVQCVGSSTATLLGSRSVVAHETMDEPRSLR